MGGGRHGNIARSIPLNRRYCNRLPLRLTGNYSKDLTESQLSHTEKILGSKKKNRATAQATPVVFRSQKKGIGR